MCWKFIYKQRLPQYIKELVAILFLDQLTLYTRYITAGIMSHKYVLDTENTAVSALQQI